MHTVHTYVHVTKSFLKIGLFFGDDRKPLYTNGRSNLPRACTLSEDRIRALCVH